MTGEKSPGEALRELEDLWRDIRSCPQGARYNLLRRLYTQKLRELRNLRKGTSNG